MKLPLLALILASTVGAASAQNANVNPYHGVSLEIERAKSELDLTKIKTNVVEEKTKLQIAEHHLNNAEKIAKATLAVKLKDSGGGSIPTPFLARGEMPAPLPPEFNLPAKQAKKPAKDAKNETKSVALPTPVVPIQTGPNLAAVIERGSDRVALFELPGGPLNAKVGTAVPGFGTIKEITPNTVHFSGGLSVKVKSPVAVADVDRQPVGVGGTGSPNAQPPQASAAGGRTIIPPAAFPN